MGPYFVRGGAKVQTDFGVELTDKRAGLLGLLISSEPAKVVGHTATVWSMSDT